MIANRSMPLSTVTPVLVYPDLVQAVGWLCDVFGFTERVRIGSHRSQLTIGDGSVVAAARPRGSGTGSSKTSAAPRLRRSDSSHSIMVRVPDVDRHYERARQRGAKILEAPADYPYGERQYSTEDFGGHVWTFSQSVADVAPEEWGGTVVTGRR